MLIKVPVSQIVTYLPNPAISRLAIATQKSLHVKKVKNNSKSRFK